MSIDTGSVNDPTVNNSQQHTKHVVETLRSVVRWQFINSFKIHVHCFLYIDTYTALWLSDNMLVLIDQRSYSTSGRVSTWMGDRLQVGKWLRYVTRHPGQLSLAIPPWIGTMSSSLWTTCEQRYSNFHDSYQKLSFRSSVFKNRLWRFGDGSSRCLIHSSSSNVIRPTVKVFFFKPYLCISVYLRLTISWTNSSQKCVISSVVL